MKAIKLTFINLFIVFVLLEGGMRIYFGVTNNTPPHSDHSVVREWRWVKDRLEDNKNDFGIPFAYDKYAGWKNAENVDAVLDNYGSIRTNSHGMRNDQDFPLEPENNRKRLLIIGDSYSFGHGVSNEDTYAYQLASLLPEWDIMNLSVSATGTDQQYIMYEKYGEVFQPDVVLLGFYVLDFNRNTFSFRNYAKPMYVPQDNETIQLTSSPVISPKILIKEYQQGKRQIGGWHYLYSLAAFQKILTTATKRNRDEGSLPRRTLTGIMEKFSNRVRTNGSVPVWVNFPIRDILEGDESKYERISNFATSEAQRLGMKVIDLDPVFRSYLDKHPETKTLWRPRAIGGHLSTLGHKITATMIYELLQRETLVSQ